MRALLTALALTLPLAACGGDDKQATIPLTIDMAGKAHRFDVEVARTKDEQEQGLMFRTGLPAKGGMLFPFPKPKIASFWMKNTPSSLDIIYIDPQGRIVSIASHATPYSETPLPSNGAANGVLELRAGRAEEIGAKPGDQVRHSFFRP